MVKRPPKEAEGRTRPPAQQELNPPSDILVYIIWYAAQRLNKTIFFARFWMLIQREGLTSRDI